VHGEPNMSSDIMLGMSNYMIHMELKGQYIYI
jgi:hypothetical protein